MRLLVCLFLLLGLPCTAAPVAVTSGEHEGFTRVVLDFGTAVDWQFGRTPDGYALHLSQTSPPYDLQQAFDLIGKSRLAAIWVDPSDGNLQVSLACACHAMPFEFRPGIVVIDLKDGPPPKGSSFEQALDGGAAPPLEQKAPPRPQPRPGERAVTYDWLRDAQGAPPPVATPNLLPALSPQNDLRGALVQEMAQAASKGVLDMAVQDSAAAASAPNDLPQAHIRMADAPAGVTDRSGSVNPDLTAQGAACIADDRLQIGDWADPTRPMLDQWSEAMAGLTGEFDRPTPDAVDRAVRFELHYGFGAEARQLIAAFPIDHPDIDLWQGLAHLLDGETDPTFAGQTACGGAAALWAMLADPPPAKGDPVDTKAVRLAFSALPVHLRRWLAPALAERFLTLGDMASAEAVRDTVLRAPGEPGAGISIMSADISLHQGDAEKAEELAAEVLSDPSSDQTLALISYVEARVAQNLPVSKETATALISFQTEQAGGPNSARLHAAAVLARAASGDFAGAFAALPDAPDAGPNLWALTAQLAPDADLITHAVALPSQPLPQLDAAIAAKLATRLLDLGLVHPAQRWLTTVAKPDPALEARLDLALADGQAALAHLAASNPAETQDLQIRALELTARETDRAAALRPTEPERAAAAMARAGDWEGLAQEDASAWQLLAAQLLPTNPAASAIDAGGNPMPALAKGRQLAEDSATTRNAIQGLLSGLPSPVP